MDRIIPILPCPSIKEQVAFYEQLGFNQLKTSSHHIPYAVVSYRNIEINFYGNKKTLPNENANMCYIVVDDVDHVYEAFTTKYKQANGKIPRSGIPRISKLKDLKEDRRFTITDMGGNTLFVGTPNHQLVETNFYRNIESKEHGKNFQILYDLIYSKEDCVTAYSMLLKLFPEDLSSIEVSEQDLAKILLVALEIYVQREQIVHPTINAKLLTMFNEDKLSAPDWKKLHHKYQEIVHLE